MSQSCHKTGSKKELIDHSRVGGRKVFIKEVSFELNLAGWVIFASGVMRFASGSAVTNPPAMQKTRVLFLDWEDPLEESMVTHSSILAWRIPWTEESGRLQSIGLQRVRHYWSDLVHSTTISETSRTILNATTFESFQMLFVLQIPFPFSFIHLTDTIKHLLCILHPHPPWSFPTLISTVFKHLSL